jgi:hypothetical protein
MRTLAFVVLASAFSSFAGCIAHAQGVVATPSPSTGVDLTARAQAIIDAAGASEAFEAVSDTRFVSVRHKPSGFLCTFTPGSQASVEIIKGNSTDVNEDVVCLENQGDAWMEFRISRFVGARFDEVFESASNNARRSLGRSVRTLTGAPLSQRSPAPPNPELKMPRRATLLTGQYDGGPAMIHVALAELPNQRFLRQHYLVFLPDANARQIEQWAMQGSVLAEQVFAAKLGEFNTPAPDPALAKPK